MKERIRYIDAMRGFTMFLVVFGHVMLDTFGLGGYTSVIGSIFLTFRMPMFFFISGYIAYKGIDYWTGDFFKERLAKKAKVQIIPALFFFSLFCYTRGNNPLIVVEHNGWLGYWFTFVLFEMFIAYYILSLIGKLISDKVVDIGLITLSCMGVLWLMYANRGFQIYEITCMENLAKYFQFFTFGILCRKYNNAFIRWMSNDYLKAGVILLFIACICFYFEDSLKVSLPFVYSFNHDILVRYIGVLLVFCFFFTKKEYFNKDNRITKIFLFVGRRTLDIYLIHFFFLPQMKYLKEWLMPSNMLLIQFTLATLISFLVIGVSLLMSEIIRSSNFLAHYLFGVKRVQ